jgi:hypothetical protein
MVQRYDFIPVPPNFLMKSFVVSELLLNFAFEHRKGTDPDEGQPSFIRLLQAVASARCDIEG